MMLRNKKKQRKKTHQLEDEVYDTKKKLISLKRG